MTNLVPAKGDRWVPARFLVVDDDEDHAELLAELLTSSGRNVQVASRGCDALEIIARESPDVVILDVSLPDMDGFDVAAVIRERFGSQIFLAALTGFSDTDCRERARQAGFNVFLAKPFDADAFERALCARLPV